MKQNTGPKYSDMMNNISRFLYMAVCYKKLWKLLIDKDMRKSDLERDAKISHYALGKMSQGKDVST